jgi:hypothetical protein
MIELSWGRYKCYCCNGVVSVCDLFSVSMYVG